MEKNRPLAAAHKKDADLLIYLFYVWTFVLIARPQDFIDALRPFRPAFSIGIFVLILFSFYSAYYRSRIFSNQQCRLYLYLLMAMIISIPFAYYRRGAFEFFFTKYMVTVLFFFLFYKIIDNERKLLSVLWITCFGTSLYLLIALYMGEMVAGRLKFGDMFDPNDLAFFAISFLPFNLLFVSKENRQWKRLVSVANVILGILLILMTGSRGGFIALAVVMLMLFLTRSKIMKLSYKIIIALLATIAIIYGGVTIDLSRFKTITQIGEDYNVFDETGRIGIWKRGIELMLNNPLTGVGVSCFNEAIGQQRKEQGLQELWQSPHNSFIQIGAETGVFGFILFMLINYKAYKIFKSRPNIDISVPAEKIRDIARIGFAGHIVSFMFLSQAYSILWAYFIAMSAVIDESGISSSKK